MTDLPPPPRNSLLAQQALARICNHTSTDPQQDSEIIQSHFDTKQYLDVAGFLACEGQGINSSWKSDDDGRIYAYTKVQEDHLLLNKDGTAKTDDFGDEITKPVVVEYSNAREVFHQFQNLITANHIRLTKQALNLLRMMVNGDPQAVAVKIIKHWDEGKLSPEKIGLSSIEFVKPKKSWFSRAEKKSIGEFLAPIVEAAYQRIENRQAYAEAASELSGAELKKRLEIGGQ